LATAALQDGWDAAILDIEEDRYRADYSISPSLDSRLVSAQQARLWSHTSATFLGPDSYGLLPSRSVDTSLLAYESSVWPAAWVEEFNASDISFAVMPCEWGRTTAIESGFDADRVAVVYHGVDHDVFFPSPPKDRDHGGITFMFCGTSAYRKGLDILLDAWPSAFRPSDQVRLLIKLAPYDGVTARPYLLPDWRERVQALSRSGFEVDVDLEARTSPEMADLYRKCDVLVSPIRGECAPIVILEAMACGMTVIATDYAGIAELVGGAGSLLDPGSLRQCIGWLPACREPDAMMAEPDVDELIEVLRRRAMSSDEAKGMRAIALARAASFSWHAAWTSLRHLLTT